MAIKDEKWKVIEKIVPLCLLKQAIEQLQAQQKQGMITEKEHRREVLLHSTSEWKLKRACHWRAY